MSDDPKLWWTPAEIAEAGLPGMPNTTFGVQKQADRMGWQRDGHRSRRRKGRGGGWEYHRELFSEAARLHLSASDPIAGKPDDADMRPESAAAWAQYDALPEKAKKEAARRLSIIQQMEAVEVACTRNSAVIAAALKNGVSERSIWNWLYMIEGVSVSDRLAYLVPRHRMAKRKIRTADYDPEFMDLLKSDYLRNEQPSFSTCYRRAVRIAQAKGVAILTEQTARRRLNSEVSKPAQIYARKGIEALKRLYPAQSRDKRALEPMEAVNADYHKWDVFVRWPGVELPIRPQMAAFQDIYSGRILSWRVDYTPNKQGVALVLGDMVERFGIPEHVLLDNGSEFANKFLTGQAPTRNRYKIKDDDIQGLLVAMGCEIHWATPYSGQSKPIERGFRDMCDNIAKDPRLAGAYTGNRPDAKPENYGNRAIPLDEFLAVVADGIEEHNSRTGRRSDSCRGRSFVETFDTAAENTPIRKATAEQKRLWLMGAEGLKCHSRTAEITYQGNVYWSDWMHSLAGQKVTGRFDPANLWEGMHIYALDGSYMGHAECREKKGFFDIEEGKVHAAARQKWMKAEKDAAKAARVFRASELGEALTETAGTPTDPPETKIVRLPKTGTSPARRPRPAPQTVSPQDDAKHAAWVAAQGVRSLPAARAAKASEASDDPSLSRYRDAVELRARIDDGDRVSSEKRRWLDGYEQSAEFKSYQAMHASYGEKFLG